MFCHQEVVFQVTHSWDLEDCQSHNCCFIFQWLWNKAMAWTECSKLRPGTICNILFQLYFLLHLRELIFLFSITPSPQFSPLEMEERKKKNLVHKVFERGAESRHLQSHEDVKWMEIIRQKTTIALSCNSKGVEDWPQNLVAFKASSLKYNSIIQLFECVSYPVFPY